MYRKCDKRATNQWQANWSAKMWFYNDKVNNLCHKLDEIRSNVLFEPIWIETE